METRTKRMRKHKAASKRKTSRNKIQYSDKQFTPDPELLKELEELFNDTELYRP